MTPTRPSRLLTVVAGAASLLLLSACASGTTRTSATQDPAPTQSSASPTASPAAARPADLDLSGITAACATWEGIDGTSIGMKNPEPSDDWTDGYWELMFPGAQVEACQWIDGYPDDPMVDLEPTDIGFAVGAVVGMGLDEYLAAGEDATWVSQETTVDGYRALGSLRTTTARACNVLLDVNDQQMLYVAWSRGGEFEPGTTFEQGCADAADLASLALRAAR